MRGWNRARRWMLGGAAVALTSVVLVGCGFGEEIGSMRDRARAAEAAILADRDELLGIAERLPDDDPSRGRIKSAIEARTGQAAAFGDAADRLEALLASAESGEVGRTIESGTGVILPFLPAGAQVPVLLAAGLAASVWRAARLKKSAVSIAEGLEKAMHDDQQLREGMKRQAATIRSVQTPTAKRIVDEVTKPGKLRLPV